MSLNKKLKRLKVDGIEKNIGIIMAVSLQFYYTCFDRGKCQFEIKYGIHRFFNRN